MSYTTYKSNPQHPRIDSPRVERLNSLMPLRLALLLTVLPATLLAQTHVFKGDSPLYTEFLDRDFPFLEATVDLRGIAPAGASDNLIPRAIILPLERDFYVCFDTELLRVAGIWKGDFTTMEGLALLSYEVPLRKKGGGQKVLPQPQGKVFAATGLYPGWQREGQISLEDPRPRGPDALELGRGPLPPEHGEWLGIEDTGSSAVLHYTQFGGTVAETFRVAQIDGEWAVVRSIQTKGVDPASTVILTDAGTGAGAERVTTFKLPAENSQFAVAYRPNGSARVVSDSRLSEGLDAKKTRPHWPELATTEIDLGAPQGAYAVDELRLPYPNPWERRIRPYGIEFLPNGDAIVVTFDGDVYRISNLGSNDDSVQWRKIAAGFNEPASVGIRGDDLFVFSRLGITQLVDNDGDGETDFYKMFCNRFTQSADTRDFAHSLTAWKDGSWIICKGGQQNDHRSPHSGRVLEISADGKEVSYFAYGLRNGYVNAINNAEFLVTSDQQGHWVPTTPFHIVRKNSFLGFQPGAATEPTEIQPAALLFPHRVAQSGIGTLWSDDPRLGSLAGSILYIEYKKPSLIKILAPDRGDTIQASGTPLDIEFEVPILKGDTNPVDGMPYLVGFQIWDSQATRLEGICRVRVVEPIDDTPVQAEVFKEGVLLRFEKPFKDADALNPANFQANSWEYLRQPSYGSAQYKADGTPGVDSRFIHSTLLSKDKKSVFLAIDQMSKTMQLEIQYHLFGKWDSMYFTINELPKVALKKEGFEPLSFTKLFASTPVERAVDTLTPIVSEARGQELATLYGCIGCHSLDGSTEGKSGPSWKGLYQSRRKLMDGTTVKATEPYLRDSILEPAKAMVAGFDATEAGMPSYLGILSDADVDSLVLFIASLRR